jgi:hypothetical protein
MSGASSTSGRSPSYQDGIGRYEITGEIGRGGMATVYVARQVDLQREVALKELRGLASLDPVSSRRFLREARLAGSFSHPNIVTVHDYFEHDRVPYIAMEYLAPGSLRPYVGRLTLAQVGGVLEGVLAGLTTAEHRGIVHRDIKPENLLVTLEGGIKIADFGIAKATNELERNSILTTVGTTVGTPNYIAPEQAMARPLGTWTDLYSLGITAFELIVGRTPFGDTEEAMGIVLRQINEPVPWITDVVPNVDPRISDWVGWLVSKSPADRPNTAEQAWEALEESLLGILGPRWRHNASLLQPGGGAPGLANAAMLPTQRAGPPTRLTSQRRTRPQTDPGLVPTMPPRRTPVAPVAPAAALAGRRVVRRLKLAAVTIGLVAVGAAAFASHAGSGITGTGQQPQTSVDQPSMSAPSTAPPTAAAPAPSTPATASLADKAAEAQQLATTYDQSASQIEAQYQGAPPTGADAALVNAMRTTSSAYSAAAVAATGGNAAGYAAAMQKAANARGRVSGLLAALQPGSGAATPPAPTHKANPCSGDSSSDDPSDDSCGGGEA